MTRAAEVAAAILRQPSAASSDTRSSPDKDTAGAQQPGADEGWSSYRPISLADVEPGDVPPPTVLVASDGEALFYAGRTNMLMGESESGKTWLALHAAAQVLETGGRVLVIDYEDEAATFKSRMLAIGADEATINDPQRVTYIRPEDPLRGRDDKHTSAGRDFDTICADTYDLAIIDGVTDAMVMEGFDPNSNAEVSEWNRLVPKAVAVRTGAATVMIDHYGKSVADPRYAIGAQHKRNMITGASYGLEVTEAIGRGKSGGGRLLVGKDRPGYVRGRAVKADKDLVVAIYTVTPDPLTGGVVVAVSPPLGLLDRAAAPAIDMHLVGALHQGLIAAGVPLSGRGWKGTIGGRDEKKTAAMEWLIGRGHVLKTRVGRTDEHRPNPDLPLTFGGNGSMTPYDSRMTPGVIRMNEAMTPDAYKHRSQDSYDQVETPIYDSRPKTAKQPPSPTTPTIETSLRVDTGPNETGTGHGRSEDGRHPPEAASTPPAAVAADTTKALIVEAGLDGRSEPFLARCLCEAVDGLTMADAVASVGRTVGDLVEAGVAEAVPGTERGYGYARFRATGADQEAE